MLTTLLCILAIGKFLAPSESSRNRVRRVLAGLAEFWIAVNNAILSLFRNPRWDIQVPENLDYKGCYLVSSNHQSWVDVLVLQRSFNRRMPFFRFFIKSQMFWVPFLGIAWWALDMPFMKRHSREKITRQPSLKGRDLENARKACEKFKTIPVAMTNFPEGTRFSPQKRDQRSSPYRNLLQPRIGGIGQVFYALADELDALIDVTIVYPQNRTNGDGPDFLATAERRHSGNHRAGGTAKIPPELLGRNFRTDREFRGELEAWMESTMAGKDALISAILED